MDICSVRAPSLQLRDRLCCICTSSRNWHIWRTLLNFPIDEASRMRGIFHRVKGVVEPPVRVREKCTTKGCAEKIGKTSGIWRVIALERNSRRRGGARWVRQRLIRSDRRWLLSCWWPLRVPWGVSIYSTALTLLCRQLVATILILFFLFSFMLINVFFSVAVLLCVN